MSVRIIHVGLAVLLLLAGCRATAQKQKARDGIYSGVAWFDDRGQPVSAHGANIVRDQGHYYLFGEAHTDTSNAFVGFNCYSSTDLYNWKFERVALPVQSSGKLGPNRVGERPKVMKCPQTGEYIMFMHVDTLTYVDQYVGYATAKTITGPYTFKGPLLYKDKPLRKWDIGSFQDQDGSGYVLIHGGEIYKLSDDYKSVSEQITRSITSGFESPAIFHKDSLYYFLGSHLTSWERNDNDYYTATSLKGPWTYRGTFAPKGTLTWNSQTSFVFPITGSTDTTFLFMGDRWAFPKQASAATYVWQPLQISGYSLSIPTYQQVWQINTSTGVASPKTLAGNVIDNSDKRMLTYSGNWTHSVTDSLSVSRSDEKDAAFTVKFTGTRIGWYGQSGPTGGFARILLRNRAGKTVLTSIVDMYSKYSETSLKFLSSYLPRDTYTLTVSVMAERGNWSDKRKNTYGSTGYFITLNKIITND